MAEPVAVIQATLAPIFLVSGAAIFLNFTQARLFRVVDRLRAVAAELHNAPEVKRVELRWQKRRHLQRAIILRNSILMGVLVIAWTVVTTLLLLFPSVIPEFQPGVWAIWTFALGLLSFAGALLLVTLDAFLSVAAVRHDVREFSQD